MLIRAQQAFSRVTVKHAIAKAIRLFHTRDIGDLSDKWSAAAQRAVAGFALQRSDVAGSKRSVVKVLVVYATREGQTEKVARRIASVLASTGVVVTTVNARDRDAADATDIDDFDLLVFGASVHVGGIEPELRRFVNARSARIAQKPRSLFLVLLSAATKDPERRASSLAEIDRRVAAQLDVDFDDTERIAGALAYSRYSFFVRWIMRRIARSEGGDTDTSRDYEYTDWGQVESYARRLATLAE